jgi:ankyrin repeat protein
VRKRDATGNTALMWAITEDDTNTATLLFQKVPRGIRKGEDWPTVHSLIQASKDLDQSRWNTLIDEFLRTNAGTSAKL